MNRARIGLSPKRIGVPFNPGINAAQGIDESFGDTGIDAVQGPEIAQGKISKLTRLIGKKCEVHFLKLGFMAPVVLGNLLRALVVQRRRQARKRIVRESSQIPFKLY